MHPRNTNVLQPDLALVSPPHLDRILVLGANHVQAPLLLALLPLIDALENKVGIFGLVYSYHLEVEVACSSRDYSWEGLLANFALKFSEIVGYHHSCDFFLHLAINPHLQALHVNTFARALTLAGRNQEIIRGIVITQAELACSSDLFVSLMNPIELPEK